MRFHGDPRDAFGRQVLREVRDCFYPDEDDWRELIWLRSCQIVRRAIRGLGAAEAARLDEARVEARALRIEADLRCGRGAEVVGELRRLLADDPLREELWALLMRALHGAGRSPSTVRVYAGRLASFLGWCAGQGVG